VRSIRARLADENESALFRGVPLYLLSLALLSLIATVAAMIYLSNPA
jgi:hypothetical protein